MELMSWLPLKSLIAAQGVNQRWRNLLPLSHLLPARRSLLALYLAAITKHSTPQRRNSRQDARFDRALYLATLTKTNKHEALPEEFRVWILEWPNTVMNWFWPGHHYDVAKCLAERYEGKNLSYRKTVLFYCAVREIAAGGSDAQDPERVTTKGVVVWTREDGVTVLLVTGGTKGQEDMKGTVHTRFYGLGPEDEIAGNWLEWLTGTLHEEHWINGYIH